MITTVYDKQMNELAQLENAHAINVDTPTNELWRGGFTLPYDDPDTQYCKPFNRVRLYNNVGEEIGLFRIMKNKIVKDGEKIWEFKLEGVMATLIDPSIPGYYQTDNQTTRYNIEFLLGFQKQQDWVLGDVEFTRYFSYYWQEENGVYNALKSIPKPFNEPYIWEFDTDVYPWVLHLRRPSTTPVCRIKAGYNMKGITKSEDPTKVITRIRPLGYSEGVNQLTIASVNGGEEWLVAEQKYIDQYGEVDYIFADKRYRNADSLKAYGQAMLDEYKVPPVTYEIDAADVYQITGLPIDKFNSGDIVRVTDDDLGTFDVRVMNKKKTDLKGKPGDVSLELSRKVEEIVDSENEVRERQRVSDVYAQGATNLYQYGVNENADAANPAVIRFYIPPEAVRINKLYLTFETSNFRGYMKGSEAGGAVATTTSNGGGQTTSAGGGTTETTESAGEHQHVMFAYDGDYDPGQTTKAYHAGVGGGGAQLVGLTGQSDSMYTYSADGTHSHSVTVSSHTHSVSDHQHDIVLDDHVHEPIYGIYKGPKPTAITLTVDGNEVPNVGLNEDNLDIKPYTDTDSDGEPTSGMHELQLSPDDLGRITGNLFIQCFIESKA
jgi:phage minor structural protein